MGDKLPQPTEVLISRLQRVAKRCDTESAAAKRGEWTATAAAWRASGNTCWQAAARLEELLERMRVLESNK